MKKNDFAQLLFDSKMDDDNDNYELQKEEKVFFEKFKLDRKMSIDVKTNSYTKL
jgi:hypothetical protein